MRIMARTPAALVAIVVTLMTIVLTSSLGMPTAEAQVSSSGGGSSNSQPSTTTKSEPEVLWVDLDEVDQNGVYHNNTTWGFLANPGEVMPGGSIMNQSGGRCSAGWVIEKYGVQYVATAAHCGEIGTRFYVTDTTGRSRYFGTMEQRVYEGGKDRGLIRIDNHSLINPVIPVSNFEYARKMPTNEVQVTQPTLCILGQSSGLSCGPFYSVDSVGRVNFTAVSTYGDSGGSVFALVGPNLYPVGVLQGGYRNSQVLAAQPLEGKLFEDATLVR